MQGKTEEQIVREAREAQERFQQRVERLKNTPNYGFYNQKVNPNLMSTKEDYQMYKALGFPGS